MSCKKTGGKKKGGSGAAEFGSYVWGKGSEQHAVSPDTNVIAVANDPAKYTSDNKVVGGSKGGDLTTVAVPVLLIAANQLYKPKKKSRKNKMRGGSAIENDLSAMMKQSNDLMNKMTPTTMPPVVHTNNDLAAPAIPGNVQVFGGGEVRQTGAGILTDIAVPAVLITANQLYKRKTGKNKKGRKHRRSRRVTFKRMYKR